MLIERPPETVTLATPTSSGLSGPGEPDGVGVTVGVGETLPGGGGEMASDGP
jgi:hypothetical protein